MATENWIFFESKSILGSLKTFSYFAATGTVVAHQLGLNLSASIYN